MRGYRKTPTAVIVTFAFIAALILVSMLPPSNQKTRYITYTASIHARTVHVPFNVIDTIKVRLFVYKNGVLVVNETDPPTWNFYEAVRALLGITFYNGTRTKLKLLNLDGTFSLVRIYGSHRIRTENAMWIGEGYQEPTLYTHNLSRPVKKADFYYTRVDGNKLYVMGTFLINGTYYIQEAGIITHFWEQYTYGATTEHHHLLMLYDVFEGFWVEPGDNITILYVLELPTEGFARYMEWWLGRGDFDLFYTYARIQLRINTTEGIKTQDIGCLHQFYYNARPPKVVEVCAGFVNYDGELLGFCIHPTNSPTDPRNCAINVTLPQPYTVARNAPIVVTLEYGVR